MIDVLSPNFGVGRRGYKPIAVVIHIMQGTLIGTDAHFGDPTKQASAHYGIGKYGDIHRYVKEENTAWHAGIVNKPSWKFYNPQVSPNWVTVGIEHEGYPGDAWSYQMKQTSAQLVVDICKRWGIPLDRDHVIGHYEIDLLRRPNCPAINKAIIDEILALAKAKAYLFPPPMPPTPPNPDIQGQISTLQALIAALAARVQAFLKGRQMLQ